MTDNHELAGESLTGVWHGQYAYPMLLEPVHFVATIIDSGGMLSGTIVETTNLPGQGPQQREASLDGARQGGEAHFLKVYMPASEDHQDVIYFGQISADRTEIDGEWLIPGSWAGRFLMIRSRGSEVAEERRESLQV